MDRRHLSIERVAPPGYLARGRSGLGHRSTRSKAPAPAPFAGTPGENVRALAPLARRRRPPLLASLLEQARSAHFGDFALAGRSDVAHGRSRMSQPLSRRLFLALTGGALAAPSASLAADAEEEDQVPALLDHIILGCNDLEGGIELVQEKTGVRPAIGGVHPGRGTRNALLSLGERRYLEIIAPDPAQQKIVHFPQIRQMSDPRLIGWAVHPPDIAAIAKQLGENKIAFQGPDDGSRKRPDGRVLTWKTINLADDRHGLLPFFIEWSADSVHPSKDAPARCRLEYFEIMSVDPDELSLTFKRIGLDLPVQRSDKARLRALISGPKGDLGLTT